MHTTHVFEIQIFYFKLMCPALGTKFYRLDLYTTNCKPSDHWMLGFFIALNCPKSHDLTQSLFPDIRTYDPACNQALGISQNLIRNLTLDLIASFIKSVQHLPHPSPLTHHC